MSIKTVNLLKVIFGDSSNNTADLENLERLSKIILLYFAFFVCFFILVPYGIYILFIGHRLIGVLELITAFVLCLLAVALTITRNYDLYGRLGVYVMGLLFLYLVYTGGIFQTGTLWTYPFPLFVLFLLGPLEGSILVLSYMFLVIIFFNIDSLPYAQKYDFHYKIRYMCSFFAVYAISAFFEYLRARNYNTILQKNFELHNSEQRLKDIAFSSNDIIWEVDKYWNYQYTSGRTIDLLGYSPEELIGMSPFDLCPEDDLSALRNIFNSARKDKGSITEMMHRYIHKSGKPVFFLTNASPILDKDNNLTGFRGVDKDITAWKKTEEALRQSEINLRQIIDSAPIGAFLVEQDQHGQLLIVESNQAADSILHADTKKYYNKNIVEIYPELVSIDFINEINRILNEGGMLKLDRFNYYIDGEPRIFEIHTLPVKINTVVIFFMDITERVEREENFKYQAEHYPLTGLANRILFMKHLQLSFNQAYSKKYLLAVLFMDLDEFKKVNDKYSHATGDILLKHAALRLKSCLRDSDITCRLGGDEFAVLLPFIIRKKSIKVLAEKILHEINLPYRINSDDIIITASIGISIFPSDGEEPEELLHKADQALYIAKSLGKNRFQFYKL